jgi:prepilin-type N-terminal cleavage/methylation domain-containing protein
MKNYRGFTLTELLVVIGIIGVLSAIVLTALNTSRSKGSDATVKQNLVGPREQAELFYYVNGNSYANVCGAASVSGVKSINSQVQAAANAAGVGAIQINPGGGGNTSHATCNASATGWAAEVPLKNGPPASPMFCTDSTGMAITTSGSSLTAGKVTCG